MTPLIILVADDEPEMLELIQSSLREAGHTVYGAANGLLASKLLAAQPIQVVITDVCMPERDGLEFIPEVAKNYPEAKIVAMSGGGHASAQGYLTMAKHMGAHRIIFKPFRQAELLAVVQEMAAEISADAIAAAS